MSGFDLIIFDCDGVLVDSEIIAASVEAELLNESGVEISVEEITSRFSGLDWRSILMQVEKENDVVLSASLIDRSKTMIDARLAQELKAMEGIEEAIAQLEGPRCICSNSSSERLEMMLTKVGLKKLFTPNIFSAFDLGEGRSKPKPDIFLHGCKQFNVKPEKAIVIEDSTHGVHGARAAGIRTIGFTGGSHTYPLHSDMLSEAGAETVIHRMSDLPATIKALAQWNPV